MIMFAHSAVMSIARDQIISRPKSFYANLLSELSSEKNPYQAYFLEYMWWYIFNTKSTSPCPSDLATNHRRQMQASGSISVLEPVAGSRLRFGDVQPISWTTTENIGLVQVELYRFGNFETVLGTGNGGSSMNWPIVPGAASQSARDGKPWANNIAEHTGALTIQIPVAQRWSSHYLLTPNDKYTVRVCSVPVGGKIDGACDSTYGESGEFDIVASIDVLAPSSGYVARVGNRYDQYGQRLDYMHYVPVSWSSYYVDNSVITLRMIHEGTGYTQFQQVVYDDGNANVYLPPDTPSGDYYITITATCDSSSGCHNRYMGSASSQSGRMAMGRSETFRVDATQPPQPPPPAPAAAAPPPPSAPFELPIIKAFRSQFGMQEVQTVQHVASGQNFGSTSTTSSGTNCEYVCRVYSTVGRRRLLFGGLQYQGGVATPSVVGCTPAQIECNCCLRG